MRRNIIVSSIILLFIIFTSLFISGCSTTILDAPTLVLTDDIVHWEQNDNATKYEISLNGVLSFVENNITSIKLNDGDTIKVRAIGDGLDYDDSIWSNLITFESKKFTITWMSEGSVLEVDRDVNKGSIPSYDGPTPEKSGSGEINYEFEGWSPSIEPVTKDVIYTAVFKTVIQKFKVIFYDEDGTTELAKIYVEYAKDAVYPHNDPQKEDSIDGKYVFDKWVTKFNGNIEADLNYITTDVVVYAKYSFISNECNVIFKDIDDTILKTEVVKYGTSATAPEVNEKEGFLFVGWDKDFSYVTSDLEVYAVYNEKCIVTFKDYDNSILKIDVITKGDSAIAPTDPTRLGYIFDGWNGDYENVIGDTEIVATYVKGVKVTFIDYDDDIIEVQYVKKGSSVNSPEAPEYEELSFVKWDNDLTNISEDIIVKAIYEIKTFKVSFIFPDGSLICEQKIEYGKNAIEPNSNYYYDKSNMKVYTFTKWDKEFININEDLVIKGVYEKESELPVFIFESYKNNNISDVNLYISLSEKYYVYGFDLEFNYSEMIINNIEMNKSSSIFVPDESNDKPHNNQIVINNKIGKMTFAWSYKSIDDIYILNYVPIFKMNISIIPETNLIDKFIVSDSSTVIISDDGEKFLTINPIIIFIYK